MGKKWILAVVLFMMIGLLAKAVPARAGGWATLTLTELPAEVVADRPFTVEFLLLQHGQEPLYGSDITTTITAVHPASGDEVKASAEPGKEPGFYSATLVLPQSGEWQWEIFAFAQIYPMPALTVSESSVAASQAVNSGIFTAWQLVLAWTAALGAGVLVLFWTRQKSRPRLAGAILLGLLSLAGFGLYWQMPQAVQAKNEVEVAAVPAIAPEDMGEALFVAKGCIQCHVNEKVTMAPNMHPIGPDITFVKRPPAYVKAWLADPSTLKDNTFMPDLPLSDAEINTLVTFLKDQD